MEIISQKTALFRLFCFVLVLRCASLQKLAYGLSHRSDTRRQMTVRENSLSEKNKMNKGNVIAKELFPNTSYSKAVLYTAYHEELERAELVSVIFTWTTLCIQQRLIISNSEFELSSLQSAGICHRSSSVL